MKIQSYDITARELNTLTEKRKLAEARIGPIKLKPFVNLLQRFLYPGEYPPQMDDKGK